MGNGLLFSSKQIYVPQALAIDSALAAECWGTKGSFKLACLRKHRKGVSLTYWVVRCSTFWYDTPSKSSRQRHCSYLLHTEQGSTCRNRCDDIYCSVRVFRFPAIFCCCRNWPQSTEGSCTQLYWNHFVHLLLSPPLACQVTCIVLRELCLQREMQFFCGGDPSSWPLGCQHRSAEAQSSAGMGRGWLAARAVAPSRARVISSCSSNSELVCCMFLMYSLGQHHKGMSQEFVYDTAQRGFLLGL